MAIPNTLKLTIVGKGAHNFKHFMLYNIHHYSEDQYELLMDRILQYTGHRNFKRLDMFWVDEELDQISVSSYMDMKIYLEAGVRQGLRRQIFVRRLSPCKLFWRAVDRFWLLCKGIHYERIFE